MRKPYLTILAEAKEMLDRNPELLWSLPNAHDYGRSMTFDAAISWLDAYGEAGDELACFDDQYATSPASIWALS